MTHLLKTSWISFSAHILSFLAILWIIWEVANHWQFTNVVDKRTCNKKSLKISSTGIFIMLQWNLNVILFFNKLVLHFISVNITHDSLMSKVWKTFWYFPSASNSMLRSVVKSHVTFNALSAGNSVVIIIQYLSDEQTNPTCTENYILHRKTFLTMVTLGNKSGCKWCFKEDSTVCWNKCEKNWLITLF